MQLPREPQEDHPSQHESHLQQPCQLVESQNLTPKHEETYNNNNNGPSDVSLEFILILA